VGAVEDSARRRRRGSEATLAAVRRIPDEKAYLYQIIQTIGLGPDLETILRGIGTLVTEATDCHACLIWFVQDDRLVVRSASAPYSHLASKASMAVGEGLGGWVVRTRRSAFIRERALEDPRVVYFPEFEEERFQSLVSVPVFSRAGEVIGVISLHAVAPHEFARADLDFLEHTASLVAGAMENARLYEEATSKVELLTDLSRLAQRIASAGSIDDLLPMVAAGCRDLLHADRCEIHLLDPEERPAVAVAGPRRMGRRVVDPRLLRDRAPALDSEVSDSPEARSLAEALWGDRLTGTPLFAPLIVGDERLGFIGVLAMAPAADASSVLSAVASHTSVAIKQHQLIDWLKEKNLVKDFFEALSRGLAGSNELAGPAARLGCDLDEPHVVLHAMPWTEAVGGSGRARSRGRPRGAEGSAWRDVAGRLEPRLVSLVSGTLFDRREASIRALIPVSGDPEAVEQAVRRAHAQVGDAASSALAIGLSNACRGADTFPRGFEEAAAAAEVGALIRGGPGVYTYDDLGPYKYVLTTDQGVRDRYQERLERLADYDRGRGTRLLHTLEGYLDGRGNVVASSRALYIHANTLRQRLARIEKVAGLDLQEEDWLSLAIAVKVVKLRLMRGSATEERGDEDG